MEYGERDAYMFLAATRLGRRYQATHLLSRMVTMSKAAADGCVYYYERASFQAAWLGYGTGEPAPGWRDAVRRTHDTLIRFHLIELVRRAGHGRGPARFRLLAPWEGEDVPWRPGAQSPDYHPGAASF